MYNKNKILLIFLIFFFSTFTFANEKVVLQLKWLHQFQFAGYYAAKEKGFYNDLGLDVEIRERDLKYNNIQQVIDGEAQYGIADSVLLLYKAKKEPVVIVSSIFQHSPGILLSTQKSGIDSPYDLNNKNMIFYKNDTDGFAILAMLKKLNVKPHLIRERTKEDYNKINNGAADIMASYITNEPFYFKKKGIKVNIIDPKNYGFDLYGDMLFTNEKESIRYPNRVKRFKEATLKGWEYALNNKEEIIELISKKYSKKSIEHLRYEANLIEKMINRDSIPIGSIDKGRIKYIYNLYKDYGLSNANLDVKNFIFEDYKRNESLIKLTEDEKKYLEQNPVLSIPNLETYPPFNFYENDEPKGYTIDYMRLIAKYLGVDLQIYTKTDWKSYLDMLKDGSLDIMPHLAKNEKREEFAEFTNFSHIKYTTGLAIRKDSTITSMKDLKDQTLAVAEKTFVHNFLKDNFPEQKLLLASSNSKALEAVSLGNASAVIGSIPSFNYYIQKNWLTNLKTVNIDDLGLPRFTELFMAVKKGNKTLKNILEKVNTKIPHNEFVKLKEKWMTVNPSLKKLFTPKQTKYLENKKNLKMCIDPNWMPYESFVDGEHIGITYDYMKLFSKHLPIPIKLVPTKNWLETIEFAKNRKCDFVTIMIETEERRKHFNFSTKYLKAPLVIATEIKEQFINDISSVLDKKIGIAKGYAYKESLQKKYPSINIVDVNSLKDGLEKVKEGGLFGFIDTLPAIGYSIQKNYIGELKVTGTVSDNSQFSIASRNDEPLLNEIFSTLINKISKSEQNKILNKWISVKYQESIDYKSIITISVLFLIVILIVMYKNNAINNINKKMQSYINLVDKHILISSTDTSGNITDISQAFCDVSGYTKEELIGASHNIIRHPSVDKKLYKELWEVISSGKVWKGELINKKKNGEDYWIEATISPIFENAKIVGYTSIRQEITNKKRIEEISIKDGLTNIYNRRHFNDLFPKYINSAKRKKELVSFIIMDVDFFKQYNDNYGHQKGDEALIAIANSLTETLHRSDDYCFRLGGEEFGLLYKADTRENAFNFADTIRKNIEQLNIEHKHNDASRYLTVSMGQFCCCASEINDLEKVYKDTDDLLYKAKEAGRNRVFLNII